MVKPYKIKPKASKKQRHCDPNVKHNWIPCLWCGRTDKLRLRLFDRRWWVWCAKCRFYGPGGTKTISWAVRKWNNTIK